MTTYPIVDIKTIKPDEVLVLLSAWTCSVNMFEEYEEWDIVAHVPTVVSKHSPKCICKGTNLAFSWASTEREGFWSHKDCKTLGHCDLTDMGVKVGTDCNGSGRVPKADLRQEDVQAAIIERGLDYNLSSKVFTIVRGQEPGDVIAFCGIGEPIPTSPMLVWADTSLDAMLKAFLQVVLFDAKSG